MDKKFIDQVQHIVKSNITDEKFGVPRLASILGLSSSQTLKKVRAETGKSVNQYIRELRLKEATKLIKKTDLTNAEISYKVGFSSQSYFNKVFRKRYGITPGKYKTQNISLAELASKRSKIKTRNNHIIKKAFYVVPIVVLFVVGYFITNTTSAKNVIKPNSIAVLPFKDMSPEDNQWFSDGISDNILTYLSQIKDLSVISFTSSSTYKNTDKKIPEIAKELGVTYILEGSVTVYEDKIKINTQLINANDEHMWSEDYIIAFEDVITIQQNVSKEIAKELELTLSPIEVAALEKYPTENMEAYQLFLKGRLVNASRKKEDLEKNIELNKQAIALDPNFAEAYAEIGQSTFLLGYYFTGYKKGVKKAMPYIEKALELNPNTLRALAAKGIITSNRGGHWPEAQSYFEKAIAASPSNATIHYQYALHLNNKDADKYFMHITMAQLLDPLSAQIGHQYFAYLINNNKIEEAEQYYNKYRFLFTFRGEQLEKESILISYKNKDWKAGLRFLETELKKEPNNDYLYRILGDAYESILDYDNCIKYKKKAYELDSTNITNSIAYYYALLGGEKFEDAYKLIQSKNYKSLINREDELNNLYEYYLAIEDYSKVEEILKDSLMRNNNYNKLIYNASVGNRKAVDSLLKIAPMNYNSKARFYAILKEKDSLYYYLGKLKEVSIVRSPNGIPRSGLRFINSWKEFDPYRIEERYKTLLRKNYLPITHWNE